MEGRLVPRLRASNSFLFLDFHSGRAIGRCHHLKSSLCEHRLVDLSTWSAGCLEAKCLSWNSVTWQKPNSKTSLVNDSTATRKKQNSAALMMQIPSNMSVSANLVFYPTYNLLLTYCFFSFLFTYELHLFLLLHYSRGHVNHWMK